MNQVLTAVSSATTVHDLTTSTPAAWFLYSIIAGLIGIIGWFIVRDRGSIKETLDRLVVSVEGLRSDLKENYAKKLELRDLERKVERLRDHMTARGMVERRAIEDSEQ